MTYDLRRLCLHDLIRRIPGTHRYQVTPQGLRVALFFTRTHARLLRPKLEQWNEGLRRNPERQPHRKACRVRHCDLRSCQDGNGLHKRDQFLPAAPVHAGQYRRYRSTTDSNLDELSSQSVFDYVATTNDQIEMFSLTAQEAQILERIAIDEEEVGEGVRLQYT